MTMLVFEGHRGLVADLGGAEVLDGSGIYVACVVSPLVALGGELLEGRTVEAHKGLLDNGLVLGIATLDVHHHSDRYTAGNPLHGRFYQIAD